MYWKGRDHGLIWHPVPEFTRRACGEPTKTARVTDMRFWIWTWDLPNMKEDCLTHSTFEFRPLCRRWELWFVNKPLAFFLWHFCSYLIQDVKEFFFICSNEMGCGSFCCFAGCRSFMLLWNKCNSPTFFLHKERWVQVCYIENYSGRNAICVFFNDDVIRIKARIMYFFSINRTIFRVSVTFVLPKKIRTRKTLN